MSDSMNDLFGGLDVDDIPDDFNLEPGYYEEVVVDTITAIKSKKGPHGIGVQFKDVDPDGFGLTAFKWIAIPAKDARAAARLKRELLELGFEMSDLREVAQHIRGTDPETAEVDIEDMTAVLSKVKGNCGSLFIKQNGEFTNITFKIDGETPSPVSAVSSPSPTLTKSTETASDDVLGDWGAAS